MTPDYRMIYLAGAPGTGKSTLMTKLTEHLVRQPVQPPDAPVAHDVLHFALYGDETETPELGPVFGAEIGKRREAFGGTDALPASIIEKAIPWVETKPYEVLLAEGARLANKRFIDAAVAAGYRVHLGILNPAEAEQWRAERAERLGREQSASWVQGRVTATTNLLKHYANKPETGVSVYVGHPDTLLTELEHLLG